LVENSAFFQPPVYNCLVDGDPRQNFQTMFRRRKPEWWNYQAVVEVLAFV